MSEAFHIIRTAPRVHNARYVGFVLEVELSVAGNAGRKISWKGNGLVQGISVQTLRTTQRRRQGLNAGASYVVEWVLLRERIARRLAMRAQSQRLWVLG